MVILNREQVEKELKENWRLPNDNQDGTYYEISEIFSLIVGEEFIMVDSESYPEYIEALREDEFLGGNLYETETFVFKIETNVPCKAILYELKEEAPGFPKVSYLIASKDSNCYTIWEKEFSK